MLISGKRRFSYSSKKDLKLTPRNRRKNGDVIVRLQAGV
jgi:hypothetical protein